VTTTRKHDSQIAPSLIKRNPEDIDILLGDKSYDDQKIRQLARQHEIRPLIKHGAFVRSRRWRKQFRELTIACLIHDVDRSL
jgi:IS5 family transposase